jgi:serralysin
MATLTITATHDYRGEFLGLPNIDQLLFQTTGSTTATFFSNQFGGGPLLISNTVQIVGDANENRVVVGLASGATAFSAAGWQFSGWSPNDEVILIGNATSDVITGSTEDNTIVGGGGADTLTGGAKNDFFQYVDSSDAVAGETVDGGAGTDAIIVDNGLNINFAGVSFTSIEQLFFSHQAIAGPVTVTLASNQIGAGAITSVFGNFMGADTLIVNAVSNVDLSSVTFTSWGGNDQVFINGTTLGDVVHATQVADTITTNGGADNIQAFSGDDTILFHAGSEIVPGLSIDGGAGTDQLQLAGGGSFDFTGGVTLSALERVTFLSTLAATATFLGTQVGTGAITQVVGSSGINNLVVNAASDVNLSGLTFTSWTNGTDTITINGTSSGENLIGSSQDDTINAGGGADTIRGGAGNDTYFVDNAGDGVVENPGEGTDTVETSVSYTLAPNVENLTLLAGGDLQGFGNSLTNTITGNASNNLIDGRAGADAMIGGAGNDTYFVDNAGDAVFENANEGNDTVFASANFTLSANVENLILQGGADLQGFGNGAVNVIYGNSGNNLLNGSAGADLMVGGLGNDTYFVDDSSDATFENPGEGNDAVFATAHYGLAADVETLVLQGIADLQGYGNNQANTLYGNTGNNLLNGAGGVDLMAGGAGNDVYFVDDPSDSCFEVAGEGNDAVFAFCNYGLAADVETLVMQGSGDFQGYGSNQANTLYGNAGNNLLNGAGGADTMLGGAGNDTYFVDNVGDAVVENPGEGTDAIFSTVDYTLPANVEALVLQGGGNLSGTGNGQGNNIFGNSGNNVLNGGGAADVLTGDAGNDTFVFAAGQGNGDTVVDFAGNGAAAGDLLLFVGYGAGATFSNIDSTHWQVNYNSGTQHDFITFSNGATIDAGDFSFF